MDQNRRRKKKQKLNPESQFRADLDQCSRNKDLSGAVTLYSSSPSQTLSLNNLNSLLYICSNSISSEPETRKIAIEFGFKLFHHHQSIENFKPNEATLAAVARLAAASGDGDYAFELAKGVESPKVRTYAPALVCFCEKGEAEKAYQVEDHVLSVGLHLEESELAALLKVSVETGREKKVYEYLHKLREEASRGVKESTLEIVESWFRGTKAHEVAAAVLQDTTVIKEAMTRNGGGWHGLGWIGKGEWVLKRTNIGSDGSCCMCGHNLVCVDLGKTETEKFADSIASLAMEREVHAKFNEFQDWLGQHSGFETIVDAANVGLYQQNFKEGGFSTAQLEAIVKEVHAKTNKWPLVVLHTRRTRSLVSKSKMIQEWVDQGILYETPIRSNDDRYWLYAAVKLKGWLVTNDEMRDHIFELLGSNFNFSRWKEKHQVRYTFLSRSCTPKLIMPHSYSWVIQESENGSWHIPLAAGDQSSDEERSRRWLCVSRRQLR
ncbi:hypothetical protein OROHE_010403 [Orobanche hederae]